MFWNFLVLRKRTSLQPRSPAAAGFGLVELVVSIAIMALVMSVILARQSAFNSAVLLRSQAYKVAFDLREIQLNAVSASGHANVFRSVLGIHFDIDNSGEYKIFRDVDGDAYYDGGEEYGLQGVLDNRFEIRAIRPATGAAVSALSVVFERPNFDAHFIRPSGLLATPSVQIDIAVRGVTGAGPAVLRTVEVTSTGQITVQ